MISVVLKAPTTLTGCSCIIPSALLPNLDGVKIEVLLPKSFFGSGLNTRLFSAKAGQKLNKFFN